MELVPSVGRPDTKGKRGRGMGKIFASDLLHNATADVVAVAVDAALVSRDLQKHFRCGMPFLSPLQFPPSLAAYDPDPADGPIPRWCMRAVFYRRYRRVWLWARSNGAQVRL